MSDKLHITAEIRLLIEHGALFVINHSAGKDSQAMTIKLRQLIPLSQLVIIHSHLPEVEWPGVKEHIHSTSMDIPVHFTQANKTFFEMVEHRKMFPSPKYRQCTSDLKRGPIQKFINNFCKENRKPLVVNCMGLRAEESTGRAKKEVLKRRFDLSSATRVQFEWLPIHHFTKEEVFATIAEAGQTPHWAYGKGMSRLSCCFCIMSSKQDLTRAAQLNPELYQRYVEKEKELNFSFIMPQKGVVKFLPQITES